MLIRLYSILFVVVGKYVTRRKFIMLILLTFSAFIPLTACDAIERLADSFKDDRIIDGEMAKKFLLVNTDNYTIDYATAEFNSVVADGQGNIYAAGNIFGAGICNFGNGIAVSEISTGYNPVLVKYNAAGEAQWAQSVVGYAEFSQFCSVAVDAENNVYVAGFIGDTVNDFGNGVVIAGAANDWCSVIVKYNSSGQAQWAQKAVGGGFSEYHSVVADVDNNIYAAGYMMGTSTHSFGNSVTAKGLSYNSNIILVKYSSAGQAQWAKTVTSGSNASGFSSLDADDSGNIYAAGSIGGWSSLGFGNGITATGVEDYNAVLVKYNSSGDAQWAQTVTSASDSSRYSSVKVDAAGSIYTAGSIYNNGIYRFGNDVDATGAYYYGNVVIVKYNASGQAQWAKSASEAMDSSNYLSLALDGSGNVYAAGYICGNSLFNFGNAVTPFAVANDYNIILLKYNPSGEAQWARTVSESTGTSKFCSIAVDGDTNIYAAGYLSGEDIFNFNNNVTVPGGYRAVLVKYNSSGLPEWADYNHH